MRDPSPRHQQRHVRGGFPDVWRDRVEHSEQKHMSTEVPCRVLPRLGAGHEFIEDRPEPIDLPLSEAEHCTGSG